MSSRFPIAVPVVVALLAAAAPSHPADPAMTVHAAVLEVQAIHRRDGMAGLEAASRGFWARERDFRCVHLDVAAGTLDRRFAEAMEIGVHPYFDAEPLLRRVTPVFTKARWNMETSNAYLQFLDVAVRGVLVEAKR